MPPDAVLIADRLVKSFGDVRALDGFSLTVRNGDLYGLVGRNGAGKTTALRVITGLLRADSGDVTLLGARATRPGPETRAAVAAIVETPAFFPRLTGLENLLGLTRLSTPITRQEARERLREFGLADAADRPAGGYSLGMKQRLALAAALAGRPRLLILDEPTNGLDPAGVRDLRETLRDLNRRKGLTILVSSHLLSEVERLATRLGVVRDGRTVVEGAPDELLTRGRIAIRVRPNVAAAAALAAFGDVREESQGRYVLRPGAGGAPEVVRALVAAGVDVESIGSETDALESLILDGETTP